MPSLSLPPLYTMLDPEQTMGRPCDQVLHALLQGGAQMIQLRVKSLAPKAFLELAHAVAPDMRAAGCRLIVNDRVDIALAVDADGVHLGQDDLPLEAARKIMGKKIIGVSTHEIAQALTAERDGADYIGFGPMFGTTTKDTGYTARGFEMLQEVRAAVKLPIVAIGGINEKNVAQVWEHGADSAAIISDILGANDIVAKVQKILKMHRVKTTN